MPMFGGSPFDDTPQPVADGRRRQRARCRASSGRAPPSLEPSLISASVVDPAQHRGDALALDEVERAGGVEALLAHDGRSAVQRAREHLHAAHPEERHRAQHAMARVRALEPEVRPGRRLADDRAVRVHDRLRLGRAARRVHDDGGSAGATSDSTAASSSSEMTPVVDGVERHRRDPRTVASADDPDRRAGTAARAGTADRGPCSARPGTACSSCAS